jgi:hypothetical protein
MFAGLGLRIFSTALNCGQEWEGIILDAINAASAGTDIGDGSIAPATEDRLHLAIVIYYDSNEEYRLQEKSRGNPGKANSILIDTLH